MENTKGRKRLHDDNFFANYRWVECFAERGGIMWVTNLQYLLKVAEMQSISKAPEQLYTTQQGLSQNINNLEKELAGCASVYSCLDIRILRSLLDICTRIWL